MIDPSVIDEITRRLITEINATRNDPPEPTLIVVTTPSEFIQALIFPTSFEFLVSGRSRLVNSLL